MSPRHRAHPLFLTLLGLLLAAPSALALSVTALFPADGATRVCPDTPLKLTFDTAPALGTSGTVRIHTADGKLADTLDLATLAPNGTETRTIGGAPCHAYPVLLSGRTASVFPHPGALAADTAYRVTVDAAVFPGLAKAAVWTFTTKAFPPTGSSGDLIIAADGTGDFGTVQGAIDWVPAGNTAPLTFHLRNGNYREIVRLGGKHRLTFRGEDRELTVVSYPNHNNLNPGAGARTLWNVAADDIGLDNLTLLNTTPAGGSQAEALRVNGRRCTVSRCDLRSHQDTLLVNSATDTALFRDSLVEGDVDFIWGSGLALFQNCEIRSLRGGYVCQMRTPPGRFGAVFLDCRFTRAPGITGVVFNRIDPNTFPGSAIALVNCALDAHITPAAWHLTATGPTTGLRFWEYQSTDLAGKPADISGRAVFSTQINATQAAELRRLSADLTGGKKGPRPSQP